MFVFAFAFEYGEGNMKLTYEDKKLAWSSAVESFQTAEDQMNKKWGWYVWHKLASPELAAKYKAARERYLDALRDREAGVIIKSCENLVKGLRLIDDEISVNNKPDEVFYLTARINKQNYYFVSDPLDMHRIMPVIKGKEPIVYTLEEIVRIIEASMTKEADNIKQAFPGAELQSITFKHKADMIDDEIPF
jgi:hypothetical protein